MNDRPTVSEIEAAARVLDAEGRFHHWWSLDTAHYDQLDEIAKDEFGAIVERMLMAAATVRRATS